jgi:hypothetical protein
MIINNGYKYTEIKSFFVKEKLKKYAISEEKLTSRGRLLFNRKEHKEGAKNAK